MKFDFSDLNLIPTILFILYVIGDKYFPHILRKKQFIHKLKFEKEFQVYQELFSHLYDFNYLIIQAGTNQSEEYRREFAQGYKEFASLIKRNKPFYSDEVYRKAKKILDHSAVIEVDSGPRTSEDRIVREQIEKRKDEIEKLIKDIEKAIRKKFKTL